MSTKDLVNAIISGEAIEIESAFNATMAEKISARLDDLRQDFAQNMFKAEEVVVEEEAQFSEEQLDELSNDTLHSYIGKAANDQNKARYHDKDKARFQKRKAGIGNAVMRHYANRGADTSEISKRYPKANPHPAGYHKEEFNLTEEEIEIQIQEVLSKDASAGEWIKDFIDSDNPKFEGKSKEKRKQMALAAYYAKQRGE